MQDVIKAGEPASLTRRFVAWVAVKALTAVTGAAWIAGTLWYETIFRQGSPETLAWRECAYLLGIVATASCLSLITAMTSPDVVVDGPEATQSTVISASWHRASYAVMAVLMAAIAVKLGLFSDVFVLWLIYMPLTMGDVLRCVAVVTRTKNSFPL